MQSVLAVSEVDIYIHGVDPDRFDGPIIFGLMEMMPVLGWKD